MLAQLKEHGNDPLTPIVVQRGLKQDQINYLYEHGREFPGVQMQDSFLRSYPYQSLAAQVLGYVGQISPEEYKRAEAQGLPADRLDRPGRRRVDVRHLPARQGRQGAADRRLARPPEGRSAGSRPSPTPRRGAAPDDRHQAAARRRAGAPRTASTSRAQRPRGAHANGGAIVALNPKDGAVLAMASYPTYQPSIFVGRKDPKKLAPLLEREGRASRRTTRASTARSDVAYPPGSTFKPVTALAAMQEGLMKPYDVDPVHARLQGITSRSSRTGRR